MGTLLHHAFEQNLLSTGSRSFKFRELSGAFQLLETGEHSSTCMGGRARSVWETEAEAEENLEWTPLNPAGGRRDLPSDVRDNILHRLQFEELFRSKTVSKSWKKYLESDDFKARRAATSSSEGNFTAINYSIKNHAWRVSGYDLRSKSWRAFPTLSHLPPPDAEIFKEYTVCGHGGLMCAEVSKVPNKGELVVFNPLTRESQALPALLHPRIPVLVHISVDSAMKSYKVVVAGSSTASDEHLSKKVEVFDSSKSKWKEACDLPGPTFGLNEPQAGVCLDGKLFFISFLESGDRGVVAFDLENSKWVENLACRIPSFVYSNTLQLVENGGRLFLFYVRERGATVEHCIDELQFLNLDADEMGFRWTSVVRVRKFELPKFPELVVEFTCVGFGEEKLLIFNPRSRDGVVYDVRDGRQVQVLEPPPPDQKGETLSFSTLNPASFSLQPTFAIDPCFSLAAA